MTRQRILLSLLIAAVRCWMPGWLPGQPVDVGGASTEVIGSANWELASRWTPDQIADRLTSLEVVPHWFGSADEFWYVYRTEAGIRYWRVDPHQRSKTALFDHAALAAELSKISGEVHDAADIQLQDLEIEGAGALLRFTVAEQRYEFATDTSELVTIESPTKPEIPEWCTVSPDQSRCVFGRGNNLFVLPLDTAGAPEVQLTHDGERGWAWGDPWKLVDSEDREPRKVSAVWSPDSRRVAMQRADARAVADYWIVNHLSEPRPTLSTVKLPLPGETTPEWQVWVVDVASGGSVQVESARWPSQTMEEFFIDPLWWSGDSQTLFFIRRSRGQRELDLCAADPQTGSSRVLVEERLDGMVYAHPMVELDGGGFLWWGIRDGWGHYSVHAADGSLVRQLTSGAFNAEDVVAVDESGVVVFLSANGRESGRNPYYQHLYRVGLGGGSMQLLTPEDADHTIVMSPTRRVFVDNFSRMDLPTRSVLREADGKLLMELETADVSGLVDAGWRPPELFVAKSADGVTDQWGVMWRPFDFDPAKRYPVVTRVYPGRMEEFIPRRFAPVDAETTLAQLGCVVVRFGNRGGTRLRGLAYREYGRDQFRDYGLADKRAVIEELADRFDFIDLDRVGIYGGSSGGFMTVSAMLVHPDFFKVGVAMTGPHDPSVQSAEWVERYAGVERVVDEDGVESWQPAVVSSNPEIAENLEGRLLMIYGSEDETVPLSHLLRMADALIEANKRFDMFVVPGTGHELSPWRYTYGLIWTYFAEHLIGEGRPGVEMFPEVEAAGGTRPTK